MNAIRINESFLRPEMDSGCRKSDTGFRLPDDCFLNTITVVASSNKLHTVFNKNILSEKFDIEPTARLSMNRLISTNSVSTSILVFNNFNICICNI